MKLSRIISGILAAAMLCCDISMNAAASYGNLSADCGYSDEEIEKSKVKPVITVSHEVITLKDAEKNPKRTVSVSVSGADLKYAATGFHIYFDKRLSLTITPYRSVECVSGNATAALTTVPATIDPTASEYDMKGIFVTTSGVKNNGKDGIMWKLSLTLPDDAAPGDVYPIDILYKANDLHRDTFQSFETDKASSLMRAYTFTQGIYNPLYNNNFKAHDDDIVQCHALADIAKDMDGYIAIADRLLGDVNDDGSVDSSDASDVLAEYSRLQTGKESGFTDVQVSVGDVNGDGAIDSSDASEILRFYSYVQTGGSLLNMTEWLKFENDTES